MKQARDFGFYRVVAATPELVLGSPDENADKIIEVCKATCVATGDGLDKASLIVFPELCVTGYSAEDLFLTDDLLNASNSAIAKLVGASRMFGDLAFIVGAPFRTPEGRLYNTAVVISNGDILGVVPKMHLPNYGEFYERRWFCPGVSNVREIEGSFGGVIFKKVKFGANQLFSFGDMIVGVEICEDLWAPNPPNIGLALAGANVIVNLSASNELVDKANYRRELVASTSARLNAAYIYVSCGPMESTKDLVYGGHRMIYENGVCLSESQRFAFGTGISVADIDAQKLLHERQRNITFGNQSGNEGYVLTSVAYRGNGDKLIRAYSPTPFVPPKSEVDKRAEEIFLIQSTGLRRRMLCTGSKRMVIGVSGGLDSTLALLVAVEAQLTPNSILGVTMPGFGTSSGTKNSAVMLMKALNVEMREVSIDAAVRQHFKDIGQHPEKLDVTYENSQARERTQILFDLANKEQGIVVGTGDLSELCLGWCTYNGDHMSSYNVNASIPKTLVQHMIRWYAANRADEYTAKVLKQILETEISPELLPAVNGKNQSTEDTVGPYVLHDFFIYHLLRNGFSVEKIFYLACHAFKDYDGARYKPKDIKKWLKVFVVRFYTQQFKRTTLPAGPKVGSVSVSPRGDLRMPDEASFKKLLEKIDLLRGEE